jgi:hypothetical protein
MVGTSIGAAALANSTQENPPAAAAIAKLADIFKASRRFMSGMMFLRWLETKSSVNLQSRNNFQSWNYNADYRACQSKWTVAGGLTASRFLMRPTKAKFDSGIRDRKEAR